MSNSFASSFFGQHKEVSTVSQPDNDDYQIEFDYRGNAPNNNTNIISNSSSSSSSSNALNSSIKEATIEPQIPQTMIKHQETTKIRYVPPMGVALEQIYTPEQLSNQHFIVILFNVACITTTTVIPVEVAAVRFTLGCGSDKYRIKDEGYYHSIIEWSLNGRDEEEVINRNFMTIYWNKTNVHGIPNTEGIGREKSRKFKMDSVWKNLKEFIRPGDAIVGKQPTVTYKCLEKVSSKERNIPMVRPVEDVVDCICNVFNVPECDEYVDRIDEVPLQPQRVDCMCDFHKSVSGKGEYRCVLADAIKVVDIIQDFYKKTIEKARYVPNQYQYKRP